MFWLVWVAILVVSDMSCRSEFPISVSEATTYAVITDNERAIGIRRKRFPYFGKDIMFLLYQK